MENDRKPLTKFGESTLSPDTSPKIYPSSLWNDKINTAKLLAYLFQRAWQESNLRHPEPESGALSPELHALSCKFSTKDMILAFFWTFATPDHG